MADMVMSTIDRLELSFLDYFSHIVPDSFCAGAEPYRASFYTQEQWIPLDFRDGTRGGGTRYILGWGGAARPLIPWPCLRQKSLIFLPCFRFLKPYPVWDNNKYRNSFLFNPLAITKIFTAWSTESRRLFIVQEKIPCLRQKLCFRITLKQRI